MGRLKRIGLTAWAIFTAFLILMVWVRGNKINRLENEALLKEMNDQEKVVVKVIEKRIREIAPDAPAKAELGDKLYGD